MQQAFETGIKQLNAQPFTGTQQAAEEQVENIMLAFFDSNGQPYQAVNELVQSYGHNQATKPNLRATIKTEPDVVIPELYAILRNKRGGSILINQRQFEETLRAGLGLTTISASGGSGGSNGSGSDNDSGNNGSDTDTGNPDDDASGDGSSNSNGQGQNSSSGQNSQLMAALVVVAGIGVLYYLSRN